MEQVRIGVIGAGRISHVMSEAYEQIPQAKLVAVQDVHRPASEKLAARFNIPRIYDHYEDLLQSPDVDAVLICVPTQLHAEITLKAAAAKKHIFCQKPMALTVEDCEAMVEAAKKANVLLQIGFMLRFTPPFDEAKKWIEQGEIGDIIAMKSSIFGWVPSAEWFYDPTKGGGVLIDTIAHAFDMFRWYCGDMSSIYASGGAYVLDGAKKYGTPDNVMASFRFRNGAMGSIYGTWTSGYGDLTMEVFGTNGTISIDLMNKQGGQIFIKNKRGEMSRPEGWSNMGILWKYGYLGEARQFIMSVLGKADPMPTGEDGKETQRMLLLAEQSRRTNEVIHL